MTIAHSVPANILRTGHFGQINLDVGTQGLATLTQPVVLIGTHAGGTATVDTPYQIFSETQAETLFGVGLEITIMCKIALRTAKRLGLFVPIWAIGIAEPSGGTAGIWKFTVSAGSAAVGGSIVFWINDQRFVANVTASDDQDAVVLAMLAAIDERLVELPITAAVDGVYANELNLTVRWKGITGRDLNLYVEDVAATGLSITPSEDTNGAGVTDITNSLAAILAVDRHIVAIANHDATDVTDLKAHMALAWAAGQGGWRFSVLAETSAIATATALDPNNEALMTLSYLNSKSTPGQITACAAVAIAGQTAPNKNFDGFVLSEIGTPHAQGDWYDSDDLETALAGGVTPLRVNGNGETVIERLVTTRTKDAASNPYGKVRDYATINTLVYMLKQVDITANSPKYSGKNMSARVMKAYRDDVYSAHLEAQELEYIQHVEDHASELVVEEDTQTAGRMVLSQPVEPVPNLHQKVTVTTLRTAIGG